MDGDSQKKLLHGEVQMLAVSSRLGFRDASKA